MQNVELDRLEKIEEGLALVFYVLMFVAFVMGLSGSTGSAFWLLVVGSCAHVGRAALAEFVAGKRRQDDRETLARRNGHRAGPEPRAKATSAAERTATVRRFVA
jgi:hypothetical protein